MNKSLRKLLLIAVLFTVSGLSGVSARLAETLIAQLQSEELRRVYSKRATDLEQMVIRAEARENILQQALYHAGRSTPVDNRAWLFALAVDLYHSLPPGRDPTGYERGDIGGKGEYWRRFQNWPDTGERDIDPDDWIGRETPLEPDRDRDWETLVRVHTGQPDNLAASIETQYIRHYFQEHVQLDDFIQPASLDLEDLSFSNPSHYPALRAYLEAMQHRIRSGLPPWEEPTESPASEEPNDGWEAVPVTSGSPLMSVPPAEVDEFAASFETRVPVETPVPEKASGMPLLMKLMTGSLLIVAIVAFMIRRERRR